MLYKFISYLAKLPFTFKRLLLILIDLFTISLGLFISFALTKNEWISISLINNFWRIPYYLSIGITLFLVTKQYNQISRFEGSLYFYSIAIRNFIFVILIWFFEYINQISSLGFNFLFIFFLNLLILTISIRVIIRDLLISLAIWVKKDIPNVAIYGAGAAGASLKKALQFEASHKVLFFLDNDSKLWNRNLNGCKIYPPLMIKKLSKNIDQILIAIPSIDLKSRKKIISSLKKENIPIFEIPSIKDLTKKDIKINTLKPVPIEDLLGRESIMPNKKLIGPTISNCNVLVTGAGGSIGSELCRQILKLNPKKLILLDNSEFNLYKIDKEIRLENKKGDTKIDTVLASAEDSNLLEQTFLETKIDTIFHAAAYKHVPLVEENTLAAIKNNIFSTFNICKLSTKYGIKNFLLISSDKAVRPTNIMGVTKRISELIAQAFAMENRQIIEKNNQINIKKTCFAMVRFGNVLGSSGSVIPLFQEQIMEGGPITITHHNVFRYFMSIQEAVELVIQSSALAKGGDVFLLDMGEPIQIKKLAYQMVKLSGLTVKDKNNTDGDIEIVETGLRPGEKLFEELLIGKSSEKTENPLIFRAFEKQIIPDILRKEIAKLEKALSNKDKKQAHKILKFLVPEWNNIKS